jgi:predicted nucleotidyltransferase
MSHPNLELLGTAAAKLRPLLPEIVFVGGCATGLLITDPGAAAPRRTYDVDVISEIASYAAYTLFSERLRAIGFIEDSREGAPLCRWQNGDLVLDVMPLDASILGFSNRWYPDALRTAAEVNLRAGLTIRAITAPYFLTTKLEAFRGRGNSDYFASHDLEDFISVIDGRPTLLDEVRASSLDLRAYLAEAVRGLLGASRFYDALPGHLEPDAASQARIELLTEKLEALTLIDTVQ